MKNQTFRRFQASKNRFVYQDTGSWRSYYTTHVGVVSISERNDIIDSTLGSWEMFTGQLDKNNNPIYVGDVLKYVVKDFNPLVDYCDIYHFLVLWDNDIKAIRCPDISDLSDFAFLSDLDYDTIEIEGNVHQQKWIDFFGE